VGGGTPEPRVGTGIGTRKLKEQAYSMDTVAEAQVRGCREQEGGIGKA